MVGYVIVAYRCLDRIQLMVQLFPRYMIFKNLTNKWQLICSENMIQLVPVVTFWSIKVINNPRKGHLKHPKGSQGRTWMKYSSWEIMVLWRMRMTNNIKHYLQRKSDLPQNLDSMTSTSMFVSGNDALPSCFRGWVPKLKRGWCLIRMLSHWWEPQRWILDRGEHLPSNKWSWVVLVLETLHLANLWESPKSL